MARERTPFRDLKSAGRAALVGCGLFIFFWSLDGAATQLWKLLGTTAGALLGTLPSVLLTGWEPLQVCSFHNDRVLTCVLHALVSFSSLLMITFGAA